MTPDDLDRILSSEDMLEPSSDFASRVMAALEQPPAAAPVRFPWLRFGIGAAASGIAAAAGGVLLERSGPALTGLTAPLAPLAAFAPELGCAMTAALLSLALASLPRLLSRA
jgi:hypothetical protein